MNDKTNPRADLDAALEEMRSTLGSSSQPVRLTAEATVACAEALSLLVDAHLAAPAPEPEPDPEPDLRESLPDDTPVGHRWVMGRNGQELFRQRGNGYFTWWFRGARKWGAPGGWSQSGLGDTRPATVGDLRRVGVPTSEWPDITAPEPEPEAEAVAALRAVRDELAKLAVGYFAEGDDARSAYRESMHVVDTEARRRGLDLGVATA